MMKKFTSTLITIFHLDKGHRRRNYAYFEALLSIVVSLCLFAFKIVFGRILNSVGLVADAVHSVSDVLTSLVVIFGFHLAVKPPDKEHPFGHGRVERIIAIIIACMLVVVGVEFFMSGFNRFREPVPIHSHWLVIILLLLAIGIKEVLFQIAYDLGERIDSVALQADAWHHRTDALSTVFVLIGFITFRFGLYSIDGVLGMIIALFIAYTGIEIIRKSGSSLIGEAPAASLVERIKKYALACEGVSDVHHIHVHDYGGKLEITVHIRLDPDMHLEQAHRKSSEVEECIRDNIKNADVTVHIEPRSKKHEKG